MPDPSRLSPAHCSLRRPRSPRRSSCGGRTKWDTDGTYTPPTRAGRSTEGFDADRGGKPKIFVLDMFPYPSGDGLHVGHPLGYIGTDVSCPLQAHDRPQRPAHDGLRRVRAARRAVRRADRPAPAHHDRGERRELCAASCGDWGSATIPVASISTTDVTYYRWTQWIFLQIFNSWYDTDRRQGPAHRRSWSPSSSRAARETPDGRPWASSFARRAPRGRRLPSASPTSTRPPSTGVPASARCWPTKRSPRTVAATGATSRCSGGRSSSGRCGSPRTPTG